MPETDVNILKAAIQRYWSLGPGDKAKRYIGQFFDMARIGTKISAKVVGNLGTYRVSVQLDEQQRLTSACSCYIGKHGGCHHCHALALTFLKDDSAFKVIKTRKLTEVSALAELNEYLQGTTLDSLIQEMKANGITQKAFAESLGMSSQYLSAVKSSERRNRYYNELGAIKIACLWVLENFGQTQSD